MMRFFLLINAAPTSPFSKAALNFCEALISSDNEIAGLFFFGDGIANNYFPPTEPLLANSSSLGRSHVEASVQQGWANFLAAHKLEAMCCSSSLDRLAKSGNNTLQLNSNASIAGLGQMVELCLLADRVITFGSRENG